MADQTNRSHALVPQDQPVPATLDANGFDPTEFEWRPVPRKPRADGWTPEVQQRFIQALAEQGTVRAACEQVDMSVASAYRLRHAPGAESFARAWAVALKGAAQRLGLARALERVAAAFLDQRVAPTDTPPADAPRAPPGSSPARPRSARSRDSHRCASASILHARRPTPRPPYVGRPSERYVPPGRDQGRSAMIPLIIGCRFASNDASTGAGPAASRWLTSPTPSHRCSA